MIDAETFKVNEGDLISLTINASQKLSLPVKVQEELPLGCVGVPFNVAPFLGIQWPTSGSLSREEEGL